jgi:Kdo2-lipid IVA lauroyltransferase/acyltransferase
MKTNLSSFLQTKTNFFILRFFCFFSRYLVYLYTAFLVSRYYLKHDPKNKKIENAIKETFPGLTPLELEKISGQANRSSILHYAEKFHNILAPVFRLKAFFKTRVNGHDKLKEFLSSRQNGKGVLLFTGHYGSVEYLPLFFALNGHKTSIIAEFSSQWLKERSLDYARRYGINVINATTTTNGMQEIFKDLKNGRIVIFLIDEFKYWQKAPQGTVTFLNREMPFFRGLGTITKGCLHYGIPFYFGALLRLGNDYEFYAKKLSSLPLPAENLARQALSCLQEEIVKKPDQWYQWPKWLDICAT